MYGTLDDDAKITQILLGRDVLSSPAWDLYNGVHGTWYNHCANSRESLLRSICGLQVMPYLIS